MPVISIQFYSVLYLFIFRFHNVLPNYSQQAYIIILRNTGNDGMIGKRLVDNSVHIFCVCLCVCSLKTCQSM